MLESVLRRLARDHWVRLHGTPRVTVLVGGEEARALWHDWLALSGAGGTLLDGPFDERIREAVARATAEPGHPIAVLVDAAAVARWRTGRRDRLAAMVDEGWTLVENLDGNARGRDAQRGDGAPPGGGARRDGVAGDGVSQPGGSQPGGSQPDGGAQPGAAARDGGARPRAAMLDARSVAEATLHEALEATPSTAGRFRLNESLSVRFGGQAAEIDLLSRGDQIAIEIDGVHHFGDLDCYRRDRRKDLLLQTQGFVVVRLLAEDVMRDVRAAVTVVCQALAYRLEERR